MLRIGAFAQLAGVSAKQLRAYDRLGLFRPVWVDAWSSYRYYSLAQIPELRRILALRQLGMPLAQIRELAAGSDLRTALERQRAELERQHRVVQERLAALEITVADDHGPDVVVRPVAAQAVAMIAVEDSVSSAFYLLESHVRDAGRRAHRPPGAIPADGSIFVPVTRPVPETERITSARLPACRVASVIHRGAYSAIGTSAAVLAAWVRRSGLVADGPLRILYLQFGAEPELRLPPGWVVERSQDFVTELQQPVASR